MASWRPFAPERAELIERLRDARDLIDLLLQDVDWAHYDLCDCGHRRMEHKRVQSRDGAQWLHDICTNDDCRCVDFSTVERDALDFQGRRRADIDRKLEAAARRRIREQDDERAGAERTAAA